MTNSNRALIFVKPDAINEKALSYIKEFLTARNITILNEGYLKAEDIDSKQIIDKHYFAISSAGYFKTPGELVLNDEAKETFAQLFDNNWQDAVGQERVINSKTAETLTGSPAELRTMWGAATKSGKIASGLYMAYLPEIEKIVINGFYPMMRQKFTERGNQVFWMESIFDSNQVSWKQFRTEIIGSTNPKQAATGSLRRELYENYKKFDLAAQPTTSDNGVHASAGPLEGLRERVVWLERTITQDDYGKQLMELGIEEKQLLDMLEDPRVKYQGKEESLFDITEDRDSCDLPEILSEVIF